MPAKGTSPNPTPARNPVSTTDFARAPAQLQTTVPLASIRKGPSRQPCQSAAELVAVMVPSSSEKLSLTGTVLESDIEGIDRFSVGFWVEPRMTPEVMSLKYVATGS